MILNSPSDTIDTANLHIEDTGDPASESILFIHPNPLDGSCWMYQTAHLSDTFHCMTIDLPGYGKSPAVHVNFNMKQVAEACWRATERRVPNQAITIVGCSIGSSVAQRMYHLRPDKVKRLILSGTGYRPIKHFAKKRIELFETLGIKHREQYIRELFSDKFSHSEIVRWLISVYNAREDTTDLATIINMFHAHGKPDPDWLHKGIQVPTLIISGSEDNSHEAAFALNKRIPKSHLEVLKGAGHACFIERPLDFDNLILSVMN